MKPSHGLFVGLLAATALAAPPAAANWETRNDAGLQSDVYVPSTTRADGTRSLLVVLHGCTQSPSVFRERGHFEPTAESFGMVVAVPAVPAGGVYAGCWDYYGQAHTRQGKHSGPVIALGEALATDASLAVDPARVYLAGLSSGATQAMITACLAPDVFSGIGVVAGPSVGTEAFQIAQVATTAQAAASFCQTLAGAHAGALADLRASFVSGTADYVVAQGYLELNAEAFRILHGGALTEQSLDVGSLGGFEPAGTGTLWLASDVAMVSLLRVDGMGHAWPAGSGAGPEISFIASEGPDYAAYLARFFEGEPSAEGGPSSGSGGAGTGFPFGDTGGDAGCDDEASSCGFSPMPGVGWEPAGALLAVALLRRRRRRALR